MSLPRVTIIDDQKNSTFSVGINFGRPKIESEIASSLIDLAREWTALCISTISVSSRLAFVGNSVLSDYITEKLIPYLTEISVGRETINSDEEKKIIYNFILDEQDIPPFQERLETVNGLDQASNSSSQAHLGSIISDFEFLLVRVATEFSKENPKNFVDLQDKVTLGEIFEAGTIDSIMANKIDRKIRQEMRGSHHDIISWISRCLSLGDFTKIEKSDHFGIFMEACQRRHLFTHNGGIVNQQYLDKCKEYSIGQLPKLGDKLTVTPKYLRKASGRSYLLGTFILHMALQKLGDQERERSLSELLNASHDFLVSGNTKMCARIIDFVEGSKRPPDARMKLSFAVNRALTELHNPELSEEEQTEAAKRIIEKYDWSVTTPIFDLALSCLRRDFSNIIHQAQSAQQYGLEYNDARSFFVFKEAREVKGFMDCFPRRPVGLPLE